MITRPGQTGWQTILADLALILFMITASALSVAEGPGGGQAGGQASGQVAPSQQAEPVGIWKQAPGAPRLAEWLAEEARDPRLRLSIVVRYRALPGGREAALEEAAGLARAAGPRAASARLVVEPGRVPGASVALGYDQENP